MSQLAVIGAGMGGLSLALALQHAGSSCSVYERAAELTEVGAGIQMGPHVMRRLLRWGLGDALRDRFALPDVLQARDARSGHVLATLELGSSFEQRYGAPYATVHRADLQQVLHQAVQQGGCSEVHLHTTCTSWVEQAEGVTLTLQVGPEATSREVDAPALIGADGLWSRVRSSGWDLPEPFATGHLAYRAMVPQALLPARLRSPSVCVWMGPDLHLVTYPVRQGEWLNVVLLLQPQGPQRHLAPGWDLAREPQDMAADVQAAMQGCSAGVRDLVGMIEQWRVWPLYGRGIVAGPDQMARGAVALLGDAAHPMLPYLAQGAGMAIEDADALAQWWTRGDLSVPQRLHRYAESRWQRNARVQLQSRRNADIFHAVGWMRWGRDLGLRLMGQRLMDQPWLFSA
jgi:salicylate hydroxylase